VKTPGVVTLIGFIIPLKVAVIILLSGTPVARFAGSVDTTSGHTPTVAMNLSFLQPVKIAAKKKAATKVIHNPLVFVFIIIRISVVI
jgi:hypothetical protein